MLLWKNQLRGAEALKESERRRTLSSVLGALDRTDNEREWAEIVMTQDIDVKELSGILYVSERGAHRLTMQIYGKAGTDSRTGLLLKYSAYLSGGTTSSGRSAAESYKRGGIYLVLPRRLRH